MLQNYNNIISNSDKIHNLKLENFPTNIILNENDRYQLVIKTNKLSLTYVFSPVSSQYTFYIPIVKLACTKFNIDWGDRSNIFI